ncbi:MAG: type IV pilus assembly protein PilM [Fimbriimonadaceae bacterium]|nr:type IV pilus assembly protein PilM [Fimbriimonadaceae bacterium]
MSLSPFRKKNYVGLDLGHYTLKVVQLERSANGFKVAKRDEVLTPPNSIKDGVIIDNDAIVSALRQLMKQAHIGATSAVISVEGGSVVVRNVRIPKMPEATLRKSIKFEAGRYVPTSVDDSYIEFEIIGYPDDAQMDVLIVAAPKDIVQSRIRACHEAGLEVEVVDIAPFAAYRALVEADPAADYANQTIALVDIGAMTTSVSVIAKNVFSMTRSIPHGGGTFTEALKTYFKLSDQDAEAGKCQLDLHELINDEKPSENPPLRVLQPHIDELIREIRRSLNYYQSQQTESGQPNPVTSLVLSGGTGKMHGLADYMTKKLGMPVTPVAIFDNPRFSYLGTDDPGSGLELSVASGLAMRAFSKAA